MICRKGYYFTRHEYPQLGERESEIWTQFLSLTDLSFSHIDYNVKIGKGAEIKDKWNRKTVNMVKALTKKRIDAIGYNNKTIYLFEICKKGNHTPLGQLLTYTYHFKQEYSPKKPVKKTVVCKETDIDALPLFHKFNISIYNITNMEKEEKK